MSTPNKNTHEDDRKPAAKKVEQSEPQFRSVDIARPPTIGLRGSSLDVIDKNDYFGFGKAPTVLTSPSKNITKEPSYTPWSPTEVRQVPAFYPLERSSRFVHADLETVVARTSEANRLLSIHAEYCDKTATATLLTSENVEMHLSLWRPSGDKEGIVIEIQRRKGDSITFHRYSRCILDAIAGDLDISDHVEKNGDDIDAVFSRKVQRMLTLEAPQDSRTEAENAIIAIEIAHGLIMKDRIDANQLGLESLCLLTDPKKTGLTTAVIASRVVLLGSARDVTTDNSAPEETLLCDETPFQEIRQALLSLIQFRRIGDGDDFGKGDSSEESEHITVLHNLALAVLANALDVNSNEDIDASSSPEDVPAVRQRLDTSESISEQFLDESLEFSENRDIMKTLINELGKAGMKPHNACLSAKCIGSLCRASEKARKKAEELGAKAVVQAALEVGERTHYKLQCECKNVMSSLTRPNDGE